MVFTICNLRFLVVLEIQRLLGVDMNNTWCIASGKDSKPDSWFLFDSYKRKRNPVTEVQELVPEMKHVSHQMHKILHRNA